MKERLIENAFPLRKVSEESVREKNIRHGHISTLHIWWARRPLAVSRTTAFAALVPDDPAQREKLLSLVQQLAPWESSLNESLLAHARALIREAYAGRAPRVLDPFAGGGAIPLEALRLGCEAYALDYNPVAVLINKAVLELPQRFGRPGAVPSVPLPPRREKGHGPGQAYLAGLEHGSTRTTSPLLEAVKAWGEWVLEEARRELAPFYPADPDGSIPVGYIWARTLPCQNPQCGAEIPLMRQTWLAKKDKKKIALRLIPNRAARRVDVEIVGQDGKPLGFDPSEGTVARADVRCPVCGGTIPAETTRRLFREGKAAQRMMAVVLSPHPSSPSPQAWGEGAAGVRGKTYRLPTEADLAAYRAAEQALEEKRHRLAQEWGIDPVPDEPLPPRGTLGFRIQGYGMTTWGDLFNARQKLALITFAQKVREAYAALVSGTLTPNPLSQSSGRGGIGGEGQPSGRGGTGGEGQPSGRGGTGGEGQPSGRGGTGGAGQPSGRGGTGGEGQPSGRGGTGGEGRIPGREGAGGEGRIPGRGGTGGEGQPSGRGGAGGEGTAPPRPSRELIERARELRRAQTPAEQLLWELLRDRQLLGRKFRRQHPIGPFIADFFCDDARLVIEIDGAVHKEASQQERDRVREEVIRQFGYHVLRFSNEQVCRETEQVLQTIAEFVQEHSYEQSSATPPAPTPPPSPRALGEGAQGVRGEGTDPDFARAVATYLALAMSRMVDYMSTLCVWNYLWIKQEHVFGRQALPMVWDYSELNPISDAVGSWTSMLERRILEVLAHLTAIPPLSPALTPSPLSQSSGRGGIGGEGGGSGGPAALHGTATALPFPDGFFDAVLTDPPYYDNVPYSHLSDFFYVWLKRTIGDLYPDLFATPLTPKTEEMVAYTDQAGGMEQAKKRFEAQFTDAFREIARVLKPDGIAVIVFAHKTTEAWESILQALLEAGLYLTASWPIHTEMQERLRAQESAALSSSIYMVCRKRTENTVGEYVPVREEIARRVRQKLAQFWDEGIRGADFFMSAIGPAVEVFGRYARVERLSGEVVTVREWLEYVQRVVAEFALERVLHSPDLGGVDAETRFYLLWRWTYNHASVPFDEANKLARAVGAELVDLWSRSGFVLKEKENVRVLGPRERAKDSRFLERERYDTLVDVLHKACILWEAGKRPALAEHLSLNRGGDDTLWRVAQSVADVLPDGDKEKQLLQGLLNARGDYQAPRHGQERLL